MPTPLSSRLVLILARSFTLSLYAFKNTKSLRQAQTVFPEMSSTHEREFGREFSAT
jgi:hypothetical protein